MQTLKQLHNGDLKGTKHLKLREGLSSFPQEIFTLSETLEVLDLSFNALSELPDLSSFKKLKIAFFSNNFFTKIPPVFKNCKELYMLGFKANKIDSFDEDILPLSISWLILTDNALSYLPKSIGKLQKLQKFAVAGNKLETLPIEMKNCTNLELIRLSANELKEIPLWLLELPSLSWLAFSGNPFSKVEEFSLDELPYSDLKVKDLLGEGASGEIYKAYSKGLEKDIAFKLFKGAVTSDGYAKDEMNAYMSTGEHKNLIKVLAKLEGDERLGLILELIPKSYKNLGLPPSLQTCTRDTFEKDQVFSAASIMKIAKDMASVSEHLHSRGLMHGDFYAHNILINEKDKSYLGDFGAASFYKDNEEAYERIEIRAYGCLLEDLLNLCTDPQDPQYLRLQELSSKCMDYNISKRPLFKELFN
ncbi:MAG TPA: protein kinase [Sulfurimonas sp.]|nr:protein kinase [Sulfurimonas sp.]